MTSNPPSFRHLPLAGRAYLALVVLAASGAVAAAILTGDEPHTQSLLFVIVAALCAAATLFEVFAPGNLSLQLNLVFLAWGAVLLPVWAIPVLAAACFAPNAIATGDRWYIATFNVADYVLAGVAGHELAVAIGAIDTGAAIDATATLGLLAAATAIVVVNHALLVGAMVVAQGRGFRRALRESAAAIPGDFALALAGVCLAALWQVQELLVALAAGPLLLMYRALWVPMLQHKSRTDTKTGLYNFEHFSRRLADTLEDAARRGYPVAVAMIDLDHLRAVNNRWGHLAGDELIRGVAELLTDGAGESGMAARFGGEEFCLMLPGANAEEARALVEGLRRHVERLEFTLVDGEPPMKATLSAGIAALPAHGTTAEELLRAADAAVYDAKLGGRNRVRVALPGDPMAALPVESLAMPARADAPVAVKVPEPAPEPPPADAEPPAAKPSPPPMAHRRAVVLIAVALTLAAALVGALTFDADVFDRPVLLAVLAAAVVLLDFIRIDVFERGHISPAAVPTLALAALFGPIGPLISEVAIAIIRIARRSPADRTLADLGVLGLAGAAAAGVFSAFPDEPWTVLLAAGLLAGLAYYVVNVVLLTTMIALAQGVSPVALFRETHAWLWPHYLGFGAIAALIVVAERSIGAPAVLLFVFPVIVLWVAEKQYLDRSRSSVDELRRSHKELQDTNTLLREALEDNQDLLARARRSYLSTITSLARTIEAKDPYTGGHTERVAEIATQLARELRFDEDALRAVNVGAVIHDIGKIGVPDRVLLKPGKLDPEEVQDIRRHPEISSYILADLDLPPIVKQMVRSHHERYDGDGYPDGLLGEEIPLAARILSVADALDAMTSDRPYRSALTWDEAITEVRDRTGTQFCPVVAEALERWLAREHPTITLATGGRP